MSSNYKFNPADYRSGLDKLRLYGPARNRDVDHELRQVTLTDNEAAAIHYKLIMLEDTARDLSWELDHPRPAPSIETR